MEIYFLVGLGLIFINIICIILTYKLKREDFFNDESFEDKNIPYGFQLLGIILSLIFFIMGFVSEYLSSNCFPTLLAPILIGYPIYYYFMFVSKTKNSKYILKKEFFTMMFALVSIFYILFLPLANDVSLSHQIELIISTNLPFLEIVIILYIHCFIYAILLNLILYYDFYNYVLRKNSISKQQFRKQHSILTIVAFIVAGYLASIILNGQFLIYPESFNFDKFQNIVLIYQIFLSAVSIMISFNNLKTKK